MIGPVIENIARILIEGLGDILPGGTGDHVTTSCVQKIAEDKLPFIKIFPTRVDIMKSRENMAEISEGVTKITKEFIQELCIEVYSADSAVCEQILSLIMGIILVESGELIKRSSANENKSGLYSTRLMYTNIQMKEGIQDCPDGMYRYILILSVYGYIDSMKRVTEGFEKIDKVIINTTI